MNDSLENNLELSSSSQSIIDTTIPSIGIPYQATEKPPIQYDNTSALSLCIAVLIYSLIVTVTSLYAIAKGISATYVMRVVSLLTIINASVFIMIVGMSDAKVAAVFGLFGTIIGYIINRGHNNTSNG